MAHRGSSGLRAEHTLEAYEEALTDGADALECDVRLTRDGVLVCVHDRRVDRTSDGRGVVSTLELADLSELDFASWKARQSDPLLEASWEEADTDPERGKVLTFERLLQLVLGWRSAQDSDVQLQVETKHPTRYGGLVERRVVKLLREFGWTEKGSPARVMSFSWTALQRIKRAEPDLDVVMLMDSAQRWPVLKPTIGDDWLVGPGIRELREHPGLGKRLRKAGRRIHVWTVNTEEDLNLCLDLGVEAVITDRPAYLLELLDG